MIIPVGKLKIPFPYDYIYPEQYGYMQYLWVLVSTRGCGLIEMPSGTGKTICILAFMVEWIQRNPGKRLILCTRTIPEVEKALVELKDLVDYRLKNGYNDRPLLGMGLTSRKNLCINSEVKSRMDIEAGCYEMVQRKSCKFYADLEDLDDIFSGPFKKKIYTINDTLKNGMENGICPYFTARRASVDADIIVCNYLYLIDPRLLEIFQETFKENSIIVFDEAHNLDGVCMETLSMELYWNDLIECKEILEHIKLETSKAMTEYEDAFEKDYQSYLEESRPGNPPTLDIEPVYWTNSVITKNLIYNMMPGNLRKASQLHSAIGRFVEYLKLRLKTQMTSTEIPLEFLRNLRNTVFIERNTLAACSERLTRHLRLIPDLNTKSTYILQKICRFGTLLSTYRWGFVIITEPATKDTRAVIRLSCLNPSLAISPIFEKFGHILITSGTLSPIDLYPKVLNFTPIFLKSFPMSMAKNIICPLIIGTSSDQIPLTTKIETRDDPSIIRNYGMLVVEVVKITPDGMAVFFPSYAYMESMLKSWYEIGIIDRIIVHKLLFIESQNPNETTVAMSAYKKAIDCGHGGVIFAVSRGRISEGIDLSKAYGRSIILIGIPYQYTECQILRNRLDFIRENYGIKESEYLAFDAIKSASQCLGRVIRGKDDYGVMFFADRRYTRPDRRSKLPPWLNEKLVDAHVGLSLDMGISIAKSFFKSVAQPMPIEHQLGVSIWDQALVDSKSKEFDSLEYNYL